MPIEPREALPRKEIVKRIQNYVHPFRVTSGKGFDLKEFDPGDTRGLKMEKGEAADLLQRGSEWLAMEQDIERSSLTKSSGSYALSPPSVIGRGRSARGSIMCSAAIRSAWPLASVRQASTTRPLRFSINACPMKQSLASLPGPLR